MRPASGGEWTPPGPPALEALAPLERALVDHQRGGTGAVLRIRSDLGADRDVAVALFFASPDRLLPPHRAALALCSGRVLDVGAGAGSVALALQERGVAVTALELLPGAVEVMRARGVADVVHGDLWSWRPDRPYDTVLALMNGTAAAGTRAGLAPLLRALGACLAPGGRILIDSTDLRDEGEAEREDGRAVGEVQYQLEYRGERGPPFPQLFVDPDTLAAAAAEAGLTCAVAWRGDEGDFLAALSRAAVPPG